MGKLVGISPKTCYCVLNQVKMWAHKNIKSGLNGEVRGKITKVFNFAMLNLSNCAARLFIENEQFVNNYLVLFFNAQFAERFDSRNPKQNAAICDRIK